jgi:hypothetical protein
VVRRGGGELECKTYYSVDCNDFTKDDTADGSDMNDKTVVPNAYLMKFLVVIRGALTPPPRIDVPVVKIPLVCMNAMVICSCARRITRLVPSRTKHTQPYTQSNTHRTPCVRTGLFQELEDIEA